MINNKGVTMIALVITIMVMVIRFGITINSGIEILRGTQLKDTITILSMIKAKGIGYQEKVDFQAGYDGTKLDEARTTIYQGEAGLVLITNTAEVSIGLNSANANYYVPSVALEKMGINEEAGDKDYIISFNDTDLSVEVYLVKGYEGKYSLTDLEGLKL